MPCAEVNSAPADLEWRSVQHRSGRRIHVVQAAGQTITLPNGSFSKLELLATAVNGSQAAQTFTVHYTDGTSTTLPRASAIGPRRKGIPVNRLPCRWRIATLPAVEEHSTFDVYGYTLALETAKSQQHHAAQQRAASKSWR